MKKLGRQLLGGLFDTPLVRGMSPHGNTNPLDLFNKDQLAKLAKFRQENNLGARASNYFEGRNIIDKGKEFKYGDPDELRGKGRKLAVGAAGALAATHALGFNPFGLRDNVDTVAALGAHTTVAHGLIKSPSLIGKAAGMGYLGATGINLFRKGDNLGPL